MSAVDFGGILAVWSNGPHFVLVPVEVSLPDMLAHNVFSQTVAFLPGHCQARDVLRFLKTPVISLKDVSLGLSLLPYDLV